MSNELRAIIDEERKTGREEGSKNSIVSLYKKGLITIEVAAEELNMSIKEFQENLDK